MTESIKPIETDYNGYKFRSRLEARWAVFFDACDIKYEYEPQGFETSKGKYLPDFHLPELGYWAEVKGHNDHLFQDIEKCQGFVREQKTAIIYLTDIPYDPESHGLFLFPVDRYLAGYDYHLNSHYVPFTLNAYNGFRRGCINDSLYWGSRASGFIYTLYGCSEDELWRLLQCIHGSELDERYTKRSCLCRGIEQAFKMARMARFEHGETPNAQDLRRALLASVEEETNG